MEQRADDGGARSLVMETHVLPRWDATQLSRIDHIPVQEWATELGRQRSRATVAGALRLTGAVLRSAVRNPLIPFNPAEGRAHPAGSASGHR